MTTEKKKNTVQSIIEKLQKSPNFVLVKFEKTPHQTLEALRKELKKQGSFLSVVKNTLFEKAINKLLAKNPLFKELKKKFFPLKHSSALLSFEKDWSKGLRSFYQFSQKEKTLEFKFGLLENQCYSDDSLIQLAQLPDKDQLAGKIIGQLRSPAVKFIYVIRYNVQKLIYLLNYQAKGGEKK